MRHRNKKKHRDADRTRRRAFLDGVKNVPCKDCNLRFPPICMDFDHVRGEKKFNIAHFIYTGSWSAVEEEIAKCEVVCSNCHRIRTWQRYKVIK